MDSTRYVQVTSIRKKARTQQSSVVFLHGFPDSPDMFKTYYSPLETKESWLKDRSLYAIALPNRQTNPTVPSLTDLMADTLYKEFAIQMNVLLKNSPSGKLILIAHDWGAAYAWRYIKDKGDSCIERMVAMSVGPSPRFDIWEHGFRALGWSYRFMLSLPYYVPASSRPVGWALTRFAGYKGSDLQRLSKDCYHYWDGVAWPFLAPLTLLGLLQKRPERLHFSFPILFIRSPVDRLVSTEGFETMLAKRPDCRLIILSRDFNHWFPAQHSELVLKELRTFLAPAVATKSSVRKGAESAAPTGKKTRPTTQKPATASGKKNKKPNQKRHEATRP
jgi:pimeloyl-ACP methyl ester carboxylesterase